MSESNNSAVSPNEIGQIVARLREEFSAARNEIFFVDASLPGAQALAASLGEGSRVFVLEGGNAFSQMEKALQGLAAEGGAVDAVHIYSHGREGAISLGGEWIDEDALAKNAGMLASIAQSLNVDADIMLYGCNTGGGAAGASFMNRLAFLTGADVAASTNLTGLGGDWVLENSTGGIEADAYQPGGWDGTLDQGPDIDGWGTIEGTSSDEKISGFVSGDKIYGRGGKDTLVGGEGNDAYFISGSGTAGTVVTEERNEGLDSIYSLVSDFDLSAGGTNQNSEVEIISLVAQTGMVAQSAKGNAKSQTMYGNALDNNLTGGGGNDLLYGYDGNDYLDGGNGKKSGATSGADYSNGERSTMYGGKGDDAYVVRNVGDVVVENYYEGTDHVYSFIDYSLGANVENLTLLDGGSEATSARFALGNTLNNELRGNKYANSLFGGAGNDTLYGGKNSEADTLDGGAGNDAYYVYSNDDVIVEALYAGTDSVFSSVDYTLGANLDNLYLVGNATQGYGNALANRIVGNESLGSTLDGGAGADVFEGGYGNDLFIVDNAWDSIGDKGGRNTVNAGVTFDANRFANANLQYIELTGASNINATARAAVATTLVGNSGNNLLTGGTLDDMLYDHNPAGAPGEASGNDTLAGGNGSDTYYVSKSNTVITEYLNYGQDKVVASADYTLGANVEHLEMTGSSVKRGTGNNLANKIDASGLSQGVIISGGKNDVGQGGDTLMGGSGNDQFYSYNAADVINGGSGNDVLYIDYDVSVPGAATWNKTQWESYFQNAGRDVSGIEEYIYVGSGTLPGTTLGANIQGTALANNLTGTARNDTIAAHASTASTLDGGAGADIMNGSSQSDVFYVDNIKDTVRGNGGTDTVNASVNISFSQKDSLYYNTNLDSSVKLVQLTGAGALSVNAESVSGGISLLGNAGGNNLIGGAGNDYLDGGAGYDVLTGGKGNDAYYIDNFYDRVVELEHLGTGTTVDSLAGARDSIFSAGIAINLAGYYHLNAEYAENTSATGVSMLGSNRAIGETLVGGSGNDTLDGKGVLGAVQGDRLLGGDGNDLVYYYGSESYVSGGSGTDTLHATSLNGGALILGSNGIVDDFEAVRLDATSNIVQVNAAANSAGISLYGNAKDNNLTGGSGNDYILTGGGKDTVSAGSGDDLVELAFNTAGYGQLNGGAGQDTLSFGAGYDYVQFNRNGDMLHRVGYTATIQGGQASGFELYSGGAGNDTLNAADMTTGMVLAGGAGNDSIIGGSGDDVIYADGGSDIIITGEGRDRIVLTTDAVGSRITVNDFNAALDCIDDSALAGWTRVIVQTSATLATVTYTNPADGKTIVVALNNVVAQDVNFLQTVSVSAGEHFTVPTQGANMPWHIVATGGGSSITGGGVSDILESGGSAGAGNTLLGGAGSDVISGGQNDALFGEDGGDVINVTGSSGVTVDGGADNDSIYIANLEGGNAASITGGAGADLIVVSGVTNGAAVSTISGGATAENDTLAFGNAASLTFNTSGNLSSIGMNGQTVGVDVSNIAFYQGSSGADSVDASAAQTKLAYSTGGGNDTYIGGVKDDTVYVHSLGSDSRISLDGGNNQTYGGDKLIFDKNNALRLAVNGSNATAAFSVNGQSAANAVIKNFETYMLGDAADFVEVVGHTGAVNLSIFSGGGNDTLTANMLVDMGGLTLLDGGDGNDSIYVNAISGTAGEYAWVDLTGGTGSDTIGVGSITGGQVQISGGTGYDSLDVNDGGNYISINSISGGEVTVLGGGNGLLGGNNGDTFRIGNISGGQTTIAGFSGYDRLYFDGNQAINLNMVEAGSTANNNLTVNGQQASLYVDGMEYIMGTAQGDTINAADLLISNFEVNGGAGDDSIVGNAGHVLRGGSGNDVIVINEIKVFDPVANKQLAISVDGGTMGNDTLAFTQSNIALTVGMLGTVNSIQYDGDSIVPPSNITEIETIDLRGSDDAVYLGWLSNSVKVNADGGAVVNSYTTVYGAEYFLGSNYGEKMDAGAYGGGVAFSAGAGNDTLIGGNGDDLLSGDEGNDSIVGGAGNDTIILGASGAAFGNDTITTGTGSDVILLRNTGSVLTTTTITDFKPEQDIIDDAELLATGWTRRAAVSIVGGASVSYTRGTQTFTLNFQGITDAASLDGKLISANGATYDRRAYSQAERVSVTGTNTTVYGGNGNDALRSFGGNFLYGGNGDDTIKGGTNDYLSGGEGSDLLIIAELNGSGSTITVDGGNGSDRLALDGANARWRFDADGKAAAITLDGQTANLSVSGVEFYSGTAADYADATAVAAGKSVRYHSNDGNDTYLGGAGADSIFAHSFSANSNLSLSGGGGATDFLYFDTGSALRVSVDAGGSAAVSVAGQKATNIRIDGFEEYQLGLGNDFIDASAYSGNVRFIGGAGNDTLIGGAGNDTFALGVPSGGVWGNDFITTGSGKDVIVLNNTTSALTTTTITDFTVGQDMLDDSDLTANGWVRNAAVTMVGGSSVTYTKGTSRFVVNFQGITDPSSLDGTLISDSNFLYDRRAINVAERISVTGSNTTVYGGNGNDLMRSLGGGNTLVGGFGNDSLIGSNGDSLYGGDGDDGLVLEFLNSSSGAVTLDGGNGNDRVGIRGANANWLFGSDGKLASITIDGQSANLDIRNTEYYASTAADFVDATAVASGGAVFYNSVGGNDTYLGGNGMDYVSVYEFNASSSLSLSGGGDAVDGMDHLTFNTNSALQVSINVNGDAAVSVAGQKANNIQVNGFEGYTLGEGNDSISVARTANAHAGMVINTGLGNDTVYFNQIEKANYALNANTGAGNDLIKLGKNISGGIIAINDFDVNNDTLDFAELWDTENWSMWNFDTITGGSSMTSTNHYTGEQLTLNFSGVDVEDLKGKRYGSNMLINVASSTAANRINVVGSNSAVYGGSGADWLFSSGATVNGGMGNTISGGAGDDVIYGGTGDVLAGGAGWDMFYFDPQASGSVTINGGSSFNGSESGNGLKIGGASSEMQFNTNGTLGMVTVDGSKVVNLNISNIEEYFGTDGADYVDASAVSAGATIQYYTDGGNDTYIGGAGEDRVYVSHISNPAAFAVSLVGSNSQDPSTWDKLYFESNNNITLNLTRDNPWDPTKAALTVDGVATSAHIEGFTDYQLGSGNDSVLINARCPSIKTGAGNDTITVQDVGGSYGYSMNGEAGSDVYNIQIQNMKAFITNAAGDGDDKVQIFGVSAAGTANLADLNSWGDLSFRRNTSGFIEVRIGAPDPENLNVLSFAGGAFQGQDVMNFNGASEAQQFFGGDISLNSVGTLLNSASANQWYQLSFSQQSAGHYVASGLTPKA